MIASLLFAAGLLFAWMAYNAYSSHEIKGRGWGFSTRIYRRDSEPVWYWVTFSCYVIIAVWTTVYAVMAVLK